MGEPNQIIEMSASFEAGGIKLFCSPDVKRWLIVSRQIVYLLV